MTESQLYEKVGRLQASLDVLNESYDQLLNTLAQVVSGEMDVGRLAVNLTARGYSWAAPGETVSLPPTINGFPKIITAPPLAELRGFRDDAGDVVIRGRNLETERLETRPDSSPAPA